MPKLKSGKETVIYSDQVSEGELMFPIHGELVENEEQPILAR